MEVMTWCRVMSRPCCHHYCHYREIKASVLRTHVLDIHGCRISIYLSIYLSGSFVEMCVKWRAAADDVFSVVWKMGFCVGEGRWGDTTLGEEEGPFNMATHCEE